LLPAVRQEVERQIRNHDAPEHAVKAHHGEPVFNDSDLQMAGYAAALKVLTGYTHIGGEDVTSFALRPRVKGEVTVVDEIVQQAAEAASNLLVPEGLAADTWGKLTGIERFVLRMMDMETTGARKLDNYQNFAKAFRVQDYTRVMASMRAQQRTAEARHRVRLARPDRQHRDGCHAPGPAHHRAAADCSSRHRAADHRQPAASRDARLPGSPPLLVDMLAFVERKAPESEVRTAAEVLGARLKNLRFGD
jgi:putative DNA methylase